jgi:hypothetical protein
MPRERPVTPGTAEERPRLTIEPDAGDAKVRFSATHLRSVDQLDVKWSSVDPIPRNVRTSQFQAGGP